MMDQITFEEEAEQNETPQKEKELDSIQKDVHQINVDKRKVSKSQNMNTRRPLPCLRQKSAEKFVSKNYRLSFKNTERQSVQDNDAFTNPVLSSN